MFLLVALKRAGLLVVAELVNLSLGGLLGLLGEEDGLDVGEDTALGDGHTGKQLVQLLVVTDGQLEVTGDDPGLVVVTTSGLTSLSSPFSRSSCQCQCPKEDIYNRNSFKCTHPGIWH